MKYLKKALKIVFGLLFLLSTILVIFLVIDANKTSYLNIKGNSELSKNSFLITNINIIPMSKDTILKNKSIVIKGGIIEQIADSLNTSDIEVIDGKNKFILPGLIDMHVHVWDKYELGIYLSNGVTAVRNLWGMPMHLRIKEEIKNNELISPTFYTTGPKLTGPEFMGDDNLNLTSTKEAKEKVISYKKRGYDFIKTYYGLTEDLYEEILKQAAISNMDVIAHPSQKLPYNYHFKSQIKSIEHAEEIIQQPLNYNLDTLKLNEVIQDFSDYKKSNFCPTLVVYNNIYQMLLNDEILDHESIEFMNPLIKKVDSKVQFERWYNAKLQDSLTTQYIKNQHDFHLEIIRKLHNNGVNIIAGTDAGIGVTIPGFSMHQELAFYKEAGLSNFEVLKTATINAAQTHAIMNNMGSIENGKIANLLILDKNPLVELSALQNPTTVFIEGRKLDKEKLTSFEQKAKGRKNFVASALRYLENLIVEK